MNKELIKQKFELFYDYLTEHNFNINKEKCLNVINKLSKSNLCEFCNAGEYGFIVDIEEHGADVRFILSGKDIVFEMFYNLK